MENYYINNDNNRVENPCLTPSEGKKRGRRGEEKGKKRLRRGREVAWRAESRVKDGFKQVLRMKVLRVAVVLGVMMAWMMPAVAQTIDYSGTYYIASDFQTPGTTIRNYNPDDYTNNFYLIPTENWISFGTSGATLDTWTTGDAKPFLTTYKINLHNDYDKTKAKWTIEYYTTSGGKDYYYFINSSGKYMVLNKQIDGVLGPSPGNRIRVHIETLTTEQLAAKGDSVLFAIEQDARSIVLRPKALSSSYQLTINNGNGDFPRGDGTSKGYITSGSTTYGLNGTIGIYNSTNDDSRYLFLEDYITRPTITYSSGNNVEISYPVSATIYYTKDGSDPTDSENPNRLSFTGTSQTVPFTNVAFVKAAAYIGNEYSNIATYQYVHTGNTNPYLVQSVENNKFYMLAGDLNGSNNPTVNTSSLPQAGMSWHFEDAGINAGVQYYYVYNTSTNGYLLRDNNSFYITATNPENDNSKFAIVPHLDESGTVAGFNLYNKGKKQFVYKKNGNGATDAVNLIDNSSQALSRWNLILVENNSFPSPVTVSDNSSTTYYTFTSSNATTFLITAPTGTATNVSTSNGANDRQKWFFRDAGTDGWASYYYIQNAVTGEAMCFDGQDLSTDQTNALIMGALPDTPTDNYKFTLASTIVDGEFYLVPKPLAHFAKAKYTAVWREDANALRTRSDRVNNKMKWQVNEVQYTCARPEIEWRHDDNGYVITKTESDATIYYTMGDGELTPTTGNPYNGPIQVATLNLPSVTIRAIVARYYTDSNHNDMSEEASVTVNRVATPVITPLTNGTVEITCTTPGASIYYEIGDDCSIPNPSTSSTSYAETGPIANAGGKYIKAFAVKEEWINSLVTECTQVVFTCAKPVITKTSNTTFTITCGFPSGANIRYTMGNDPADPTPTSGTLYDGEVTFTLPLPFTVKAIAYATNYNNSEVATQLLTQDLNQDSDGYYVIANNADFGTFVSMVNGSFPGAKYKITNDINASGAGEISVNSFSGELKSVAKADGTFPVVSNLSHAIFNNVNGGTVKNVMLDNVNITTGTNVGAICNEATGESRIYNCGVLATDSEVETDQDGYTKITTCSSTISGSGYVGGLVGLLDGSSRVINCFSYANITGGDLVGGIVGKNNVATTATNLQTMVMNCMFYGDITGGSSKAPIYNGEIITNVGENTGVSNYNYFWYGANYVTNKNIDEYNCALAAETRYLQRFEFFRHLLNSHRELAAWWATGDYSNKDEMLKWVMEPNQIGTSTPYPILKTPGQYASVVNYTPSETSYDNTEANRNKGYKLTSMGTSGKLSVTIQIPTGTGVPTGAGLKSGQAATFDLIITDKDFGHFNFNYGKVQLPYYNEYCTGNYKKDGNNVHRVVTGWKIVSITGTGSGTTSYSSSGSDVTYNDQGEVTVTPFNFADRNCTQKDLYGTGGSNRVFNQGAYWDVPAGVTAITIQPYWAKAVFLSDAYPDVVYNEDMSTAYNVPNVGGGVHYTNGSSNNFSVNSETVSLTVYTSVGNAITALSPSGTVYDNAIVLVGNYHNIGISSGDSGKPFTIMSADFDCDNEPDYSYILRFNSRNAVHPVRVDFLSIPGLGMAQKSTGGKGTYNFGIMQPLGWFESTNTSLFRVTQFEYDRSDKVAAPLILQGGVMEQWVSGQNNGVSNKTTYYHVGGNVWFKEFHRGTHQDKTLTSKHPPVSVTGGDYNEFYLTGLYRGDVANYEDNAECYVNGGRFGTVAGAAMEGIGKAGGASNTGNIYWQVQNADVDEFYGGGLNGAHPVEGNIITNITGGYIKQFCGGPKFGDMNNDKKVKTTANGSIFDTYFGAGYGGNSYSRYAPYNVNNIIGDYGESNWNTWLNAQYTRSYSSTYGGVSVTYFTQYIPMSSNYENVARLLIDFVSFSLATTHNVTSDLTGCIIKGNFYGGGSLGKVQGPVNSTLTSCIVQGNAFGAGYSATTPKVKVRNTGNFVKAPFYDENLGVYFDPVFPADVDYEWENNSNYPTSYINTETHKLYTNEDLGTDNLGSVEGNVTLTIKGSSVIGTEGDDNTGNVFGGGDQSVVKQSIVNGNPDPNTGNTTVILSEGAHVRGNVYGGGNNGSVGGDSQVKIQDE